MNADLDHLIHGYFDDTLSDEQLSDLEQAIAHDPAFASRFAHAALLHDRLGDQFRTAAAIRAESAIIEVETGTARSRPVSFGRRALVPACAAAVLVSVLFVLQVGTSRRALAANAELTRLIAASGTPVDRTYRIVSLNPPQPPGPPPGDEPGRVRPPIDGALLYARGDDQHVLIRYFPNGERVITGSNPRESWSVPPRGPVQVSSERTRFRGPAPGEKQNLPFMIPDALSRLRRSYVLSLDEGSTRRGTLSRIIAWKRSGEPDGPARVDLWFPPGGDVIERMRLQDVPSPRGRPLSFEFRLISQANLDPNFFEHSFHHTADRVIEREP